MKFLTAILFVALSVCVYAVIDHDKAKEMATIMLAECKEKEGGSDADVELLMNLKYPETPAGNCMIACVHEKMGFFTDGVFNRDLFMVVTQQVVENDPGYMEAAEVIATKCGSISGDRCDQAVEFDKCMEAEIKARNLFSHII